MCTVAAGRLPGWDLSQLVHRVCPVCGAEEPVGVCQRPDQLTVSRCSGCSMLYLADIPNKESLKGFYKKYSQFKGFSPCRRSWFSRRLPSLHSRSFDEILEQSGGVRNKRICEIGCSSGGLLERLQDNGASVFGVEWDESALNYLKTIGIPAAQELDTAQQFDVVCAFQLLEHLADPAALIKQIGQVLPRDGRVLLAMPNGGEAERVGNSWVGYRVDFEHLNYFSVGSLSRLLSEHDLYVEQFWEYLQPGVVRENQAGRQRHGLRRTIAHWLSRIHNQPFHSDGTYVLSVLARKGGNITQRLSQL